MSAPKTNRIKFDLNPEQIHQLTKEIIEASTKIQDAVAAIPDGEHTFENTVLALADDDCEVSTLSSMVDFPQYVSTIPEIRDASSAASTELQKFQVESNMRRDVYKSLLKFRDSPHPELTPLQQRLFDRTLRDFKRNGLDLPDDKYDRLKEINKEISELGIKFQKNLNEENTKLEFTREELEGLPDDFFSGRETTPEGKFVVTLKYPDLLPIVQLAKRPETRKRINDVNALKLNEENTPLLERTLKLRREAAHLLGYPNHASYILEIRMAKSPELVKPFLADLSEKLDSAAHKELAVLQGLKEKDLQELGREGESKEIFGHDFRYYHDKNLRDNYQVDDQAIKKYFPLDVVTKGMLSVYEDILSLRFEEIENPHVWFEEVKMFAVHDAETNEFMGHFYLDLFPRQGKYGHAAAFPLQPRHINRKTGEVQFPVAAMVANFSKPTPDKPSLLLFDEVVTFFHEFGHIMHGMCTRAEYSRFSGTSVERDFVEAPSQMLENWCYEPDVLRRISGHYEDHSKTLPEEMLQPLVRAKNADTGLLNRRQIFFGTFDQIVHSSEEDVDTGALWRQLRKEITLIPEAENANPAASFGHIMGGYDSQYYGYLYSEVFSADMYEKFKKEGVLSKQLGRLYRDVILAPGGSVDSMESLVKFLGREPTQDAFLRHIGIAPEQA